MSTSAEDLEVKTSTESAQTFIEWFYSQVSDRKPLDNFYVNSNTKYAATGAAADISINGFVCSTPSDFAALLETQATGRSPAQAAQNGGSAATNGRSSASSASASHRVRYDVDGFDVQVLNPNFRIACPDQLLQRLANSATASTSNSQQQQILQQKMASLLVQVTGQVVYGGGKDATRGPFTEVFVLVPNWDVLVGGPRAPRGLRSHLILSQNFRAL